MEKQVFLYKRSNHVGNLNNMRLSSKLCDVTIKVNNHKFRAHKVVLAANLKYFESMFMSSFQESKQDVVTMKGLDPTNLETFICFAYTGDILLTDENALGLFEVANYLGEDEIKEACIEFLRENLSKEQAYRIYQFANVIDCPKLKNLAKRMILSNFEDYSETTDYLDFDCETLKDILCDVGRPEFLESQEVFFEGLIKWIVHNVKDRKKYISDLLSLIDMTQLAADYLLQYFCKSIENKEYGKITRDVMSFYGKNSQCKKQQKKQKQQVDEIREHYELLIVGGIDKELHFQLYDFAEKKWSEPCEFVKSDVPPGYVWNCGAIMNNKCYYYVRNRGITYLQALDPVTKQSTTLATESRLLSFTTICASTKFIYFCGGVNRDESESDQVLRYDPQTNNFEALTPMETARSPPAAIAYQSCLYVLGGKNGSTILDSVEKYDPNTKKWTELAPMCTPHSSPRVVILNDKLYVCGAYGDNSVEVYDPSTKKWQLVAKMMQPRCDFLAVVHEGKLLAVGGNSNRSVEVYDSSGDKWQKDNEMGFGLKISFGRGGLILTSSTPNTK